MLGLVQFIAQETRDRQPNVLPCPRPARAPLFYTVVPHKGIAGESCIPMAGRPDSASRLAALFSRVSPPDRRWGWLKAGRVYRDALDWNRFPPAKPAQPPCQGTLSPPGG